jgi:alpha-beta hydrolase superfamily lysophospholipase
MSDIPAESAVSTYTASSGDNLAMQDWALPDDQPPRAKVLLVHGLGEHVGRYDRVARRLNDWGFAVRGYDHYGHGDSDGGRGALSHPSRLVDDLADLVEWSRRRIGPALPLVLFGHSLGGLVAASAVARGRVQVDALVLSSPALATHLSPVQKLLLAVVPAIAPNLAVGNGLDANFLSHDPAVVAAYRADPRVHDRISGRLGRFIADEGPHVVRQAAGWSVPTLLLYAGADRLVDPAGSRAFAAAAPPSVVSAHCLDGLYHEILNEDAARAAPVFERLRQWLDARF